MCPLCITAGTLALAGAGMGSAGGLVAALAAKVLRGGKVDKPREPGAPESSTRESSTHACGDSPPAATAESGATDQR